QHQVVLVRRQFRINAPDELSSVVVADVVNQQTDYLRASTAQAARLLVNHIAQTHHRVQPALARFGQHVGVIIDDARDGGIGHTGFACDVYDGNGVRSPVSDAHGPLVSSTDE